MSKKEGTKITVSNERDNPNIRRPKTRGLIFKNVLDKGYSSKSRILLTFPRSNRGSISKVPVEVADFTNFSPVKQGIH